MMMMMMIEVVMVILMMVMMMIMVIAAAVVRYNAYTYSYMGRGGDFGHFLSDDGWQVG